MEQEEIKFIFLKTPQLRHQFKGINSKHIVPVIKHEIYKAKLSEDNYEFEGRSYSGTVSKESFFSAIREGYVLVIKE